MDFSTDENGVNNTNLIYHKISIAESNLKEFNKEESLYKALNIIKELFNTNNKTFITILFNKMIETYSFCDNKTRYILNTIIAENKTNLKDIFIKKELGDIFLDLLSRSDPISRFHCIELIYIIPEFFSKRSDLIYSLLYHLIGENLEEEKIMILNIFKTACAEIDMVTLLVENFEIVMKTFGKNFKLKYYFLLLFKEVDYNGKDLLVEKLKNYIINNHSSENFKILSYMLLLLRKYNMASFFGIIVSYL
jgi:hypothetical protein